MIDRDGFALRWVREGNGIPTIVVGSERFYRRYFPLALRAHLDVVFCDARQWAATPDGFDIATITNETFCDDIDAVRQVVGFERPIVMGQSQHGAMALEHGRRRADDVRGVVAVASPPPRWGQLEPAQRIFEREADVDRLAAHERNRSTRRIPASVVTSQDFIDDYVADGARSWFDPTFDCSPLWQDVEVNLPAMVQIVGPQALGSYDLPVDVPVLIALGRHDHVVPLQWWDDACARLGDGRCIVYERSGHHPPYEEPDAFAADLVEWARHLPA